MAGIQGNCSHPVLPILLPFARLRGSCAVILFLALSLSLSPGLSFARARVKGPPLSSSLCLCLCAVHYNLRAQTQKHARTLKRIGRPAWPRGRSSARTASQGREEECCGSGGLVTSRLFRITGIPNSTLDPTSRRRRKVSTSPSCPNKLGI